MSLYFWNGLLYCLVFLVGVCFSQELREGILNNVLQRGLPPGSSPCIDLQQLSNFLESSELISSELIKEYSSSRNSILELGSDPIPCFFEKDGCFFSQSVGNHLEQAFDQISAMRNRIPPRSNEQSKNIGYISLLGTLCSKMHRGPALTAKFRSLASSDTFIDFIESEQSYNALQCVPIFLPRIMMSFQGLTVSNYLGSESKLEKQTTLPKICADLAILQLLHWNSVSMTAVHPLEKDQISWEFCWNIGVSPYPSTAHPKDFSACFWLALQRIVGMTSRCGGEHLHQICLRDWQSPECASFIENVNEEVSYPQRKLTLFSWLCDLFNFPLSESVMPWP